jgi:hypothetical protein
MNERRENRSKQREQRKIIGEEKRLRTEGNEENKGKKRRELGD